MSTTENKTPAIAAIRFCLYGDNCFARITLAELATLQRESGGDLWARGEDSGCEGSYCEVARWNYETERWEKFAFAKFHGFDHPTRPELNCDEAADFVAAEINEAGFGSKRSPIVSRMPFWKPTEAKK